MRNNMEVSKKRPSGTKAVMPTIDSQEKMSADLGVAPNKVLSRAGKKTRQLKEDRDFERERKRARDDEGEVARTTVALSKKQRSAIKVGTRMDSHEKMPADLEVISKQKLS